MYVQIACTLQTEQIRMRQERSLLLGCIAVFVALFVINYLDYMKKMAENDYVEWDIKTITASDYTIEFDITSDFFNDFVVKESTSWISSQQDRGVHYTSRVEAFRDWIQHEMEQRLDKMPEMGYESEPVEFIKVAMTTFAFKNQEVINLLKARGQIIIQEKWDEMPALDAQINQLKNDHLEEMTTPCSVFMTFADEEGVNRALKYHESVENDEELHELKTWLGCHEIEIEAASEPTDIIWENRHFTPIQRSKKSVIATLLILTILLLSFVVIFICSQYSVRALLKYPAVDCSNLTSMQTDLELQQSATIEYNQNKALEEEGQIVSY